MKNLSENNILKFSLVALLFFVLMTPLALHAVVITEYAPLAPLPGADGFPQTTVNPSTYIVNLFMLVIGIASGLAVLTIAYAGIKYMLSDVVTDKSRSKEHFRNALLGLLLAISSYLILNTISPTLTNLDILTQLDKSPPKAPPPPAPPPVIGYELRYNENVYTLSFRKREYELTYTSTVGNILIIRYEDYNDCNDGAETARTGNPSANANCNLRDALRRPPSGEAPAYGIPLPRPVSFYSIEPVKREEFGSDETACLEARENLPPFYYIQGNAGTCAQVYSTVVTTQGYPLPRKNCEDAGKEKQSEGNLVLGCFPIY